MKNFLLGCVVGGIVVDKLYDVFLKKIYDVKEKPSAMYSKLFNNFVWDREENAEAYLEALTTAAEETGYVTIEKMLDMASYKDVYRNNFSYFKYATTYGLTKEDISKTKTLKSITKGGKWTLDFNDGLFGYFDHFTRVVWGDEEENMTEEADEG